MDVETSTVIHKIQPSMHKIVKQLNGIVISVTHKPNLYNNNNRDYDYDYDDNDDNKLLQTIRQQKKHEKQTQTQTQENVQRITISAGKILTP
mmetsp:Transcript_9343/g.10053  ORF Transcript_9343/g.10053 Transcript_9343/m.10053 type:complete len:92 (-) Transcript_9343:73-348(-)